jgi:hypothetical protein
MDIEICDLILKILFVIFLIPIHAFQLAIFVGMTVGSGYII